MELTSRRSYRRLRFLLPLGAMLFLAACAGDAELDTRENLAGPEARDIEQFLNVVLYVAYGVFFLVLGATLYSWYKFRVKGEYEEDDWPEQVAHNTTFEWFANGIPAVILVTIGIFTVVLHNELNDSDENQIQVEVAGEVRDWEPQVVVIGQQWWWAFQYYFGDVDVDQERVETLPQADITTATQMVIPVGQEIELEITSRDVIHSFWIPSLNGKRDAVPGRQSAPWKIQADEPGVYFGQCTEFCGLSHSRMRMQVVALPQDEFQAWIDSQMTGTPLSEADAAYVAALQSGETVAPANAVQRGISTFRAQCAVCHLMTGVADDLYSPEVVQQALVAGAAPDLTHFASRTTFAGGILNVWDPETKEFNANDLRRWLANPEDVKANFTDSVSDEDLRLRGMPNLDLAAGNIDDLVALFEISGVKPSDEIIEQTGVQ